MMIKKHYILIVFLLLDLIVRSRNIDSLKNVLKISRNDTVICNTLFELAESADDDEWPKFNEQLKIKCESFLNTCSDKHPLRKFYLRHLAHALNDEGFILNHKGEVDRAIECYARSLEIEESIGNKAGMATSLNNLGFVYSDQSDVPAALDCYTKSLKISEELNDKESIATTLGNLGTLHDDLGNMEVALEYYNKSFKLSESVGDKKGMAVSLNNLGHVYQNMDKIELGLDYYEKALKAYEVLGDKEGIATSLSNIGTVYDHKGDLDKALPYYRKSLELSEQIDDKMSIAYSLRTLAQAMLEKGDLANARTIGERSLKISRELGYPINLKQAAETLSKIYMRTDKWEQAYEMEVLYKQMNDSINNEVSKKASIQRAFQYTYEKKAAADSVKTAEERRVHEAQIKQEHTQRYALYGGLALVAAFFIFIFNRFRITQKQKVIIEEQKENVDLAYEKLHEKNKEITDSIQYARRIQTALLTSEKYIGQELDRLRLRNIKKN